MSPSLGRIVHVQVRPHVWRPGIITGGPFGDGLINVQVFLDGPNDVRGDGAQGDMQWFGSLPHEDAWPPAEGPVWRWPPRI